MSQSVTVRQGRGTYANGVVRRQSIVDAAAALFARQGFTPTTMLDLAAAASISRAGLLHHFPDKEAVLTAVLQSRDEIDRLRFAPYAEASGALGVLRGIVDLAADNATNPELIALFSRLVAEAAAPEHPAHRYLQDRYDRIRLSTTDVLVAGQRQGLIRGDLDGADAAVRLTALMDGLQVQWLLKQSIDMASSIRAGIVEMLTPSGMRAFESFALPT